MVGSLILIIIYLIKSFAAAFQVLLWAGIMQSCSVKFNILTGFCLDICFSIRVCGVSITLWCLSLSTLSLSLVICISHTWSKRSFSFGIAGKEAALVQSAQPIHGNCIRQHFSVHYDFCLFALLRFSTHTHALTHTHAHLVTSLALANAFVSVFNASLSHLCVCFRLCSSDFV